MWVASLWAIEGTNERKKCQPHVKLIKSIINHAWPFNNAVVWWNKILLKYITETIFFNFFRHICTHEINNNKWNGCNIDATRGICFQCYLLQANFYFYSFFPRSLFYSASTFKMRSKFFFYCCCCCCCVLMELLPWHDNTKIESICNFFPHEP